MLCEKCKKRTATVFYNENLNGKVRSYSLCGECAAKLHEKGDIGDITSMLGSFADPFCDLHDNLFVDNANSGIFISAAKGVRVENNTFRNCCYDPQSPTLPYAAYDIVLANCDDVTLSGNTSDRGEATLCYLMNCQNVEGK